MIHFVIVGILVVASTAGLYRFVFDNPNFSLLPAQASTQAVFIDELFQIHWLVISFFVSLIIVFLLYSVIVFRRKAGDEGDGEHFEGNTQLEIMWILLPLILVLVVAVIGAQTLDKVEMRSTNELEVKVIASQWNWRFEYPEYDLTSDVLVIPLNQPVLLKLTSEDVIHSFWVPEFRVKQDVLPGGEDFIKELRITPTKINDFKIRCAELCGQRHYAMLADVKVVSEFEFDNWIVEQSGECVLSAEECGNRWANQFGCVACHSIDGSKIVGPSWLGLFESEVPLVGGTTVFGDEDYIRRSILEPDFQIHEGFVNLMPSTFGETLTTEQIDQIIAFIISLK